VSKKKGKKVQAIFCNPDICDNCQYIGEGDSLCDATGNIVLSDWEATDDFMKDCPLAGKGSDSE